ncbi:MAG TPA: hypothetical protein VJR95_07335 [Rhodanobacter sp.]|nr:hypothetical protein [Rhodanobacter sp.]
MNWYGLLASCVVAGVLASPVRAGDMPDVKVQAVLSGIGTGGTANPDGVAAETIWLKGDRVRVDFDAGQGRRGRILRDGHGHAWLFMSTSDRALPARNVKIGAITQLDPVQPCWELGFACEKVDDRIIAGRLAHGWRYRHAEQSGPGGTDSGVFWIDAQYGLLLAFEGKDVGEHARRMETTALDFQAIPATTFEAPEGVRQEIDEADRRADALRGYSH